MHNLLIKAIPYMKMCCLSLDWANEVLRIVLGWVSYKKS
jgi:hypothetical protein